MSVATYSPRSHDEFVGWLASGAHREPPPPVAGGLADGPFADWFDDGWAPPNDAPWSWVGDRQPDPWDREPEDTRSPPPPSYEFVMGPEPPPPWTVCREPTDSDSDGGGWREAVYRTGFVHGIPPAHIGCAHVIGSPLGEPTARP